MRFNRRMESRPNLVHRLAVGLLVFVLAVGLWQGYGPWLIRWMHAHVA